MPYTTHGHHIPGTIAGSIANRPKSVARCGGVRLCPQCKDEVAQSLTEANTYTRPAVDPFPSQIINEDTHYPAVAMGLVVGYIAKHSKEELAYEVYCVWFCKTLQNWKALVSTTLPDGMYYEVTYNGDQRETYLDAYSKIDNVVIRD